MKVLNFGSLNIDHTYYLNDFPKPGETISSNVYEKNCGGKGLNQSIAIKRAGAEVIHIGKIGKDGDMLLDALKEENINTDFLKILDSISTGHAIIFINEMGENIITTYAGANRELDRSQIDGALSFAKEDDIVLFQNEINDIEYIAKKAKELGLKVVFNPAPFKNLNEFPFELIDILILNEIEGEQFTSEKNPNKVLAKIIERYPDIIVILTLGENGVVYQSKDEKLFFNAYIVNVVDTTAAGDTFVGYFLANVMEGKNIHECIKKASLASAVTVTRKGALKSIPRLHELKDIQFKFK